MATALQRYARLLSPGLKKAQFAVAGSTSRRQTLIPREDDAGRVSSRKQMQRAAQN